MFLFGALQEDAGAWQKLAQQHRMFVLSIRVFWWHSVEINQQRDGI
jgi:hypothetical protein